MVKIYLQSSYDVFTLLIKLINWTKCHMNKCHMQWVMVFWACGIDKRGIGPSRCNKAYLDIKNLNGKVEVNLHG